MTGSTIAHYRVLEKLGEGGMGAVYKAEDTRLSRMVALKFLSAPPAEGGLLESRFLHEARAAAALDHPNICGIYEINVFEGKLYMAMPLIEGESLEKRIEAGPRPLKEALTIAIQTAEGLEEAHSKGIVHRDIKPGNILVVERDRGRLQVKILDFGLARLNQATKLTREGTQLGTAAYMSPEQVEGSPVDLRSDVWSLGVVLYEMAAGQVPFRAEYEQALFYGILNEQPEPLTAVRSGVPMELERIVNKCMAKSVNQRYPSMADLLVDLNAVLDELGRSAPSRRSAIAQPAAAVEEPKPERKTPAWLWLPAGAALGALAMWALWPTAPPPDPAPEYEFTRVTWDGQFSGFPALSPDGTLLAFASDRSGRGDLDIWVKQVNGGSLVRVTDAPEDELLPSFSPDGSQLAYYRWGQGAYTVPTLGGEPYLVAGGAGGPSWAPDGKSIAYIKDNALYTSPVSMGEPTKILSGITNSSLTLWTPDGKHVLVAGQLADGRTDWWAAPTDGSEVRSLGTRELFENLGLTISIPDTWSLMGDSLVFDRGDGEIQRIGFDSGALRVTGRPALLTAGAGIEIQPSASRLGTIAFMNAWQRRDIWSLPLPGGEPERLTPSESSDTAGDGTPDGRRIVYVTNRWGQKDIWTLNVEAQQEAALTSDDDEQSNPVLSRDGERVAYMVREEGKSAIYVRPFGGGVGRPLCADCGAPSDWSPDGERLLFDRADPPAVAVVEVKSGRITNLIAADGCAPKLARYSPDGKAVVFQPDCKEAGGGLYVAPLDGTLAVPRETWVELTSDPQDSYPAWGPEGDRIYFMSRRLGSLDIWTERLNRKTWKPLDEPSVVHRFPLARYSMDLMSDSDRRLSIGGGRIFFALSEAGGSVWLMAPKALEK
jgi:Tol biopolymer transport system component